MLGEGRAHYELRACGAAAEQVKEYIDFNFLNRPKQQTRINDFYWFTTQP